MKKLVLCSLVVFCMLFCLTLTSCVDIDGILSSFADVTEISSVNEEVVALARGDEGVLLEDAHYLVKRGESVSFSFKMKEGYHYISNTKDAECSYESESDTYTITFTRVISSFTVDIISMSEDDFYNVEVCYDEAMGSVEVDGVLFSPFASEISLCATPNDGYVFTGYSEFNYLTSLGDLICEENIYTFTPERKTTVVFVNFEPIELPPPPEPYTVQVMKNTAQGEYSFVRGSATMTEPEEVTVEAIETEEYRFLGFSSGGFLGEGGTLLCAETAYTFTPENKNTVLYLNYERIVIMRHTVEIIANHTDASFTYLQGDSAMEWPTTVEIKASVPEGYIFSGFSKNAFLVDGGEPLNKSENYSFYATDPLTVLYANYTKIGEYHIVYHVNGGTVGNSEVKHYTFTGQYNSHFMLQYTLHDANDKVAFARDGYVLVGYSTTPVDDYRSYGSANYIPGFSNLGGICEVDRECGVLLLYCVWAKESPITSFTYEEHTYTNMYKQANSKKEHSIQGYRITAYHGDEKTIVIPEKINGIPVVGIAPNVILQNSTQIGRIVLPKTVCCVEENAFVGACDLVELVFFNALQVVYNNSFSSSLMTLVINSQRSPAMNGAEGSFIMKYERMRYLKKNDEQILIVLSGSSSLNGLNSRLLSELLEEEYQIINYGTNAGANMLFYLKVISNYVTEGDLVVYAPEYTMQQTFGSNSLGYKTFRGNDQGYDIFREVDISEFTNVFSEWMIYQKEMMVKTPGEYQNEKECGMNIYGDLLGSRNKNQYKNGNASNLGTGYLSDANAQRLNAVNSVFVSKGASIVLTFAPGDKLQFTDSSIATNADKFAQNCANKLDFAVISNPGTYLLEEEFIFNSQWHPTFKGANIRTVELAFDILLYLDCETDSYMTFAERQKFNATAYPDEF